jgi:NADH-quinone oxidoreductase subunit F
VTNDEIFELWANEPAPLLPILHAFHERDDSITDDAIRAISEELRIPKADLYGTVTFYHHLSREPRAREKPRVCDGPICCMKGSQKLIDELGATPMPCSGRCDEPIPVLIGNETKVGSRKSDLENRASPLPPAAVSSSGGGREECVFAHIREPDRATIGGYRRTGGYKALEKILDEMSPDDVLDVVEKAGLAGRGGAGFPTARKWRAVRESDRGPEKYVVCNADEGEPGCFKDRVLLDHDPHAVIEGMILAGYAMGASTGFLYLRYEYPETFNVLEGAIKNAYKAGVLGDVLGSGFQFDLYLRRGAGAYICGEETSLLNSLEGKHPFPRNRPPYPVTHGYDDKPTAVNNVETLASVAPILVKGADWYQSLGEGEHAGTKLISLSGDVQRPGNYEVPIGLSLSTLLNDWAGGPRAGRSFQAVTMAGLSGGFLAGADLEDATLDEPCLRSKGSFLGAGGVMVFDDTRDMVDVARQAMSFFAHESCGKCFPCRIGTQRLTERLSFEAGPKDLASWKSEVVDIGATMKATSACGLGVAAPLVTESLLKHFEQRVSQKLS